MLRHIVTDLHEHYVNEVLKPKLGSPAGQSTAQGPGRSDNTGSAAGGSDKRIRQAVYDIRYRARREEIPIQSAFTQYMAHTAMNAMEKKAVREKLGLDRPGGGGAPAPGGDKPQAENTQREEVELSEASLQKFKVRVTDKESGKTYVRMATREKIAKLRSNPFIASVEMTKYGKTYEGGEDEADKAKKDYDGDGNVESGAKEYRGVIHNKIQQKKGGKPDGKDTSSVKEALSTDIEDPNDLKNAVKKAVKRIDTNVSGDVNKKDKSMGEFGEFVPSPDGKKKVTTMLKMGDSFSEEFSNWRSEVTNFNEEDGTSNDDVIEQMPRGKKNKIKFNPEVALENFVAENGGKIISVEEVENIEEVETVDEGLRSKAAALGGAALIATGLGAEMGKKVEKDIKQIRSGDVTNVKKGTLYDKIGKRNAMLKQLQNQSYDMEGELVDEEKKKLPYLKMFRKAGNLGRDGSPEAMERSKKITKVMNDDAKRRADHRERDDAAKEAKRMKNEEVEQVDERTRYAKETGKDPQTGKPSVKGGNPPPAAMRGLERELRSTGGLMSSRRKPIQPQGKKKVPGAKVKGVTPVDRIKGELAKKRAPKPNPYRPRAGESD